MRNAEPIHDTAFAHRLIGRRMLLGFAVLLSYGGVLWLQLVHIAEGATDASNLPWMVQWLRDASLALPVVLLSVVIGGMLARRILEHWGTTLGDLLAGALVPIVIAAYASAVLAVGNPIHSMLFPTASTGHGGHDLPLVLHALRDGLLALSALEPLALGLAGLMLASRWLQRGSLVRGNAPAR
jgi:hypothetical protein